MPKLGKQMDIFAAIDQALGVEPPAKALAAAIERQMAPNPSLVEPMREIPRDPEGDALLRANQHAEVRATVHNSLAGMDARRFQFIEPPEGDTATMTPGQLVAWLRAAEFRCQWAFTKESDTAWCAQCLNARDCYVYCRRLLQASLERTYAHLFPLPWQQMVAAIDADTARAIDFVQGAILYANAFTPFNRDAAGALLRPAHGRLVKLGLIPPDTPLVAGHRAT